MNDHVVVVAHRYTTMPDVDLVAYLVERGRANVLHIRHSFSHAQDRRSYYTWYRRGEIVREGSSADFRWLPEPLVYVKELFATLLWARQGRVKWDLFVGLDGLCTLFGLFLRVMNRVSRVVFWSIDFVPSERFAQRWKNAVYRKVNSSSSRRADEVWDLSQLMAEEKKRILGLSPDHYRRHRIVPHGVWTERIPRVTYQEAERSTLAFMGHLLEKQGVQLVLKAIPIILKDVPDFRFKIIGDGDFAPSLRGLMNELKVQDHVDFLGLLEDDMEMEHELASSGAAIAPYIRSLDTFTQYGADPGKIKIYLGCGLPILVTDVPWIAREIESRGCGRIISEDTHDIASRVIQLLTDEDLNQRCRDNSARYALDFDYSRIFDLLEL